MAHAKEIAGHRLRHPPQPVAECNQFLLRSRRADVHDIQAIFQDHGVVHGAPFEMPAVGKNLLADLVIHDLQTLPKPAVRIGSGEKETGEEERLAVLEVVVRQKVLFEIPLQPEGLLMEAAQPRRVGPLPVLGPEQELDPIHDPQGDGERLPCVRGAGRVRRDPVFDQFSYRIARPVLVQNVIKVVEVVPPEFVLVRAAPIDFPVREAPASIEKCEFARPTRRHPPSDGRCEVYPRPQPCNTCPGNRYPRQGKAVPEAAVNLFGTKVPGGLKIHGYRIESHSIAFIAMRSREGTDDFPRSV